jgi:choline dehydrogenase
MVNAMCTWLPPDSDWNYIQNITGDASWSADNMRKIFERIEKNNYLPKGTAGHGFNGYFQTNMNKPASIGQPVLGIAQAIAQNFSYSTAQADILTRMGSDANYLDPQRDWTTGIFGLPQHTKANGDRYSSRDYIQDTLQKKFPLKLSTTSLATRVLFDLNSTSCGGVPRATGIEYLQGKSIYKADARYSPSNKGTLKTATARKEVILSGGTFNTPQLLMLSGIGPKEHLSQFNIPVIVDAPGVGRNLMDNQEMPIIGQFQGQSSGFTQPIIMMKTKHSPDGERDMFVMQGPFAFRGFWPSNQSTCSPFPPPHHTYIHTFPSLRKPH